VTNNEPSEGDVHTLYLAAHHDIWWAKEHVWTATNWALALLGVLVSAAALLYPGSMTWANTWPFAVLSALLSTAASGYLARLHYDIVRARRDAAFIRERRKPLDALYHALPKHRETTSDAHRGLLFLAALVALIALALGLTLYVLTRSARLALAAGLVELLLSFFFLFLGVRYGAVQEAEESGGASADTLRARSSSHEATAMPETVETQFAYYSHRAGDLTRQLGLAALALIWLFHTWVPHGTPDGNPAASIPIASLSGDFKLPILFIVASLWIDAVQYVVGTSSWGVLWFKGRDKDLGGDHKRIAGVQTGFIILKLSTMLVAYSFLLPRLWGVVEWGK